MVLDSQLAGSGGRGRHMVSRRRRSRIRPVPILVIAVILLGGYMIWFRDGGDAAPTSSQASAPTQNTTPQPPPIQHIPPAPEPEPEPEPAKVQAPPPPAQPEPEIEPAPQPQPQSIDDVLEQVGQTKDRVLARRLLTDLLVNRLDQFDDPREAASSLRQALTNINLDLVYSRKVYRSDALTERYTIKSGDALSRIARKHKVTVFLLSWINGLKSADVIRVGQKIKLIKGPFHAVVTKSDFRMDFFLRDPDTGDMLYINSVPVGLGEDDSTPEGNFIVRPGSKVVNPEWADPVTGKIWPADDPKNPIGEFWIGIEGADERTADLAGYGIHGTVEPDSIGKEASMGCVRLNDTDIALAYRLLVSGQSTVTILP